MPEEVTYEPDTKLIRLRAWGDDPIENWIASREQIIQLNKTHGAFMLLVDARELETTPSILDIFDFGEEWPREIRAAIIAGENTAEDVSYLETVAIGRAKQIRIFFDEDMALSWLRDEPSESRWGSTV